MYIFNKSFRITGIVRMEAVAVQASNEQLGDSREMMKLPQGVKEKMTFRIPQG